MNTRTRVKAIPVLLAASLGLGTLGKALAHDNHVQARLQPTGLPELELAIAEEGVTGIPASIEAGRYLVKATGPAPRELGPSGAIFVQLPEGTTAEQAYEDIAASEGGPPPWYLEATFNGGVVLANGTESWAVVDFIPGPWMVTTMYGMSLGVEFEVTGELAEDLEAPEANATLELLEMEIRIKDGELTSGENVVTVENNGAQLHFVDIGKLPDGTTKEQVETLMESFMTGTPPAEGGLQEDDLMPVAYLPELSPGLVQTWPLTLEVGTYMLSCWIPDVESSAPHAMMGMWELITVA